MPAALLGIGFALFAVWGAGWQASGLSLLLVASAVPLYLLRPRRAPQHAPDKAAVA